jgi:Flp pilus assembly protein TadD
MDGKIRLFPALCVLLSLSMAACASSDLAARKERAQAAQELGEAYMRQKAYTRALREFLRAEQIYDKDPFLQNDLGLAYMAKGEYSRAVEHFQKALELNPDFSPARNNLGAAHMENENWEEAVEAFLAVKDDLLYATPHFPLTNLGFIFYHKGDYEKSLYYYREALDMMPGFPKALHGQGRVYLAQGRYDKAVMVLERAAEAAPGEARIHLDLGRAYRHIHEYNKAYRTFKKAAALGRGTKWGETAEEMAEAVWNFQ